MISLQELRWEMLACHAEGLGEDLPLETWCRQLTEIENAVAAAWNALKLVMTDEQ